MAWIWKGVYVCHFRGINYILLGKYLCFILYSFPKRFIQNYMAITNLLIDIYVFIILQTSKGVIVDNPIVCLIFIPYQRQECRERHNKMAYLISLQRAINRLFST